MLYSPEDPTLCCGPQRLWLIFGSWMYTAASGWLMTSLDVNPFVVSPKSHRAFRCSSLPSPQERWRISLTRASFDRFRGRRGQQRVSENGLVRPPRLSGLFRCLVKPHLSCAAWSPENQIEVTISNAIANLTIMIARTNAPTASDRLRPTACQEGSK
jgi:hypothetical protein